MARDKTANVQTPTGQQPACRGPFLALGHHDALINKLHRAYQVRWETMGNALQEHFPGWAKSPGFGGTSFWSEGPEGLDASELTPKAMEDGIVIEPGEVFFVNPKGNEHYFRLGFSSIPDKRIEPGLEGLRRVYERM